MNLQGICPQSLRDAKKLNETDLGIGRVQPATARQIKVSHRRFSLSFRN